MSHPPAHPAPSPAPNPKPAPPQSPDETLAATGLRRAIMGAVRLHHFRVGQSAALVSAAIRRASKS